jgi:hypothetical protein
VKRHAPVNARLHGHRPTPRQCPVLQSRCLRSDFNLHKAVFPLQNPIVAGVPFETPTSLAVPVERRQFPRHADFGQRVFDIRIADSGHERADASLLIDRMYATRGYLTSALPDRAPDNRITLVASEGDRTIGTITLGFDIGEGLLVDQLFGDEVAALRDDGLQLAEFTKLAIDGAARSTRVLASLFHAAYIFAQPIKRADRLLIEVNPRHVGYYRRMLGFERLGDARLNPRVDAPAVLMALDLQHARRQIALYGGSEGQGCGAERSLYPWFFAQDHADEIAARARAQLAHATRPRPTARIGNGAKASAAPTRGAALALSLAQAC